MFHFVDNLRPQLPYQNIMIRLGVRLTTQISDKDKVKIDNVIFTAQDKIKIKAVYKMFDIKSIDVMSGCVTLATLTDTPCEQTFQSKGLAKNLADCTNVCLVGITAGKDIVAYRDEAAAAGETFVSVIADAVGSECVEAGLEMLHGILIQNCLRQQQSVNKMRFSPGYGDLALTYQHIIKQMIPLDRIGVVVSDSAIMYPEKSITAFIGVR